ncbi:hypothetical protein PV325_010377 [Microctonus aethiopoides]|nr:hypothetical protein PV325_010377 [Microctonus aethiopoides]
MLVHGMRQQRNSFANGMGIAMGVGGVGNTVRGDGSLLRCNSHWSDGAQPQSGGHKIACNFAREPYRISIVHAQRPLQCRLRTGNHPSNG